MGCTFLTIGMFLGFLLLQLAVQAWFLQLGARWARVPRVSFLWAMLTTFASILAAYAVEAAGTTMAPEGPSRGLILLGLSLAVMWVVTATMLKASFGRGILAWLPTLAPIAAAIAMTFLVVRPYLFEAFAGSSNAMAPTLLGAHRRIACPVCNGPAFASAASQAAICAEHFHMTQPTVNDSVLGSPDRFLANKFLSPRRWDIVVYRSPSEPSNRYVARVAGLPGETVIIRNGKVFTDGREQTPPASIARLSYTTPDQFPPRAGTDDQPARLGADEYFVLGDFSKLAADSRLWTHGAPGHPPYAVPASYVEGVVTHIYWPLSRMRTVRE